MSTEGHLTEAKKLYQEAAEEFERAKERSDSTVLRDACGKGWLSAVEVTYDFLIKKGINEEELPKTDRGRRYMVNKYAERELKWLYSSLRNDLHIEGYYDGTLSFEEVQRNLADLDLYIRKVEELKI